MNSVSPFRKNPVLTMIRLLLTGGSLGLAVYWGLWERGVYAWLAVFQVRHFDSMSRIATWCLTILSTVLPALVLILCVSWVRTGRVLLQDTPGSVQAIERSRQEANRHGRTWAGWMLGGGLLLVGVFFVVSAWLRGPLVFLSVEQLLQPPALPSRYAELTGSVAPADAVWLRSHIQSHITSTQYVPLRPRTRPQDPVGVWIAVAPKDQAAFPRQAQAGTFRGTLSWFGTPVLLRHFAQEQGLSLREPAYVLSYQSSPFEERIGGFGVGGFGLFLLVMVSVHYRWRKRANPLPRSLQERS